MILTVKITVKLPLFLALLMLSHVLVAAVSIDIKGFNPIITGDVRTVVQQPDGKILIGGSFTSINGVSMSGIARLNTDGSLDTEFDAGGVAGTVLAISLQADKRMLIVGEFSEVDGVGRNRIARLNPDGSLDTEFARDIQLDGSINTVTQQSNGKTLIGGFFFDVNGIPLKGLARLNSDGSLDTSFNARIDNDGELSVNALILQSDGKLVIGGNFSNANNTPRRNIARLNSDGSLDDSFDPGESVNGIVFAMSQTANGKIIIGGTFSRVDDNVSRGIAGLNADGSIDAGFAPDLRLNNSISTTTAIVSQADGKVLVAGGSRNLSSIARLNADGSLDSTFKFGANFNRTPAVIVQNFDGKIFVGGPFDTFDGQARTGIALLNPDGTLDNGFNPDSGANNQVRAFSQSVDGKLLIGGNFTRLDDTPINRIARLKLDGTLDQTFDPGRGANDEVFAIAQLPSGKAIIGGEFTQVNNAAHNRIARLNANGSLDAEFNRNLGTGANDDVRAIAVQADGKVLIAGSFTTLNGLTRNRIARLNADGTVDAQFNPGAGANQVISSIALQPDGKVLIAGFFTTVSGLSRNRIARLNNDGSLDTTFNSSIGASGTVLAVALQPDGNVLLGGLFSTVDGEPRSSIARLNANGRLDSGFDPGTDTDRGVNSIMVSTNGKILISGTFTRINGTARNRIARLNNDGSLDTNFDPGSGANNFVSAIAQQADGKILIGGGFTSVNGVSRNRIARLVTDEAALQELKSDMEGSAVKWLRGGTSPELVSVSFEVADSLDGVWLPLGEGERIADGWQRTGLNLPKDENFFVRARGVYRGGLNSGSQSITESVQQLFLAQAVNDELCLPIKAKNGKFAVICL